MRSEPAGIAVALLLTACGKLPSDPSGAEAPPPSLTSINGALVAKARNVQTDSGIAYTCEGDPVAYGARMMRHDHLVWLRSGTVRMHSHLTVQMRGTSLSTGAGFVGQQSILIHTVYPVADGGTSERRVYRLTAVVQGPPDNYFGVLRFEVIFENGDY